MDKIDLISYWENTSDSDYNTMIHLFTSGDYQWALYNAHALYESRGVSRACHPCEELVQALIRGEAGMRR
jgi:hypothetical protein